MTRANGLSNVTPTWDDYGAQSGPGIAELDAPAGAYPRVTGGPFMLTHPHPPRLDGAL